MKVLCPSKGSRLDALVRRVREDRVVKHPEITRTDLIAFILSHPFLTLQALWNR